MTINDSKQEPFLVQRAFSDVDELGVLARAWDLDFRQLNRGGFLGSLTQFGNSQFHVGHTRLRGVIHQQGSTPDSLRTFAIPARSAIQLMWRGHSISAGQILVFPLSGELDSLSNLDFDMFVISLSDSSLEGAARDIELAWDPSMLECTEVVSCDPSAFAKLRGGCKSMCAAVDHNAAQLLQPAALEQLERRIAKLLVLALTSGRGGHAKVGAGRRVRQVEAAVRIARVIGAESITVSQLCREVGTSERSLRRGFREILGVSPKSFLKAQLLIGARRSLRAADPASTQVSDIANRLGIWHLGQFAADYRRHFGELPSQTLLGGCDPLSQSSNEPFGTG